jgi:tRNA A37 threonylcarbamoyladenosine modification protein TsaB
MTRDVTFRLALEFGLGASLALGRDDGRGGVEVLTTRALPERRHGELAVPAILAMLKELDLGPKAIRVWVTNRGPGSYSGLRVAYATLKGFLHGRKDAEWVAVDPIAAIASAAPVADGHVTYPLGPQQVAWAVFRNRKIVDRWSVLPIADPRRAGALGPDAVDFDASLLLRASAAEDAGVADHWRTPAEWNAAVPDYGVATAFKKAF